MRKILFLKITEVILITWALTLVTHTSPTNILTLLFCILAVLLTGRVSKRTVPENIKGSSYQKENLAALICGGIFSLFYTLGDSRSWSLGLDSRLFILGITLIGAIGLWVLFYNLLLFFFDWIDRARKGMEEWGLLNGKFENHIFGWTVLITFTCWIPYFLYLYPGIMTPDSVNQLEQALGMIPYSNHHPVAHTLLIKSLFNLGYKITGDRNAGIAFYTIFQMAIGALTAGYAADTVKHLRMNRATLIITVVFYALLPFNGVYAVTMWKDVLFGYACLALVITLTRIIHSGYKVAWYEYVILAISSIVTALFRSNGWYGFILISLVISVYLAIIKKSRGIIAVLLGAVLVASIIRGPVFKACHVSQPNFAEGLAVPTQQISQVLCNDREIDAEDRKLIESVVDLTYIKELYAPGYSDNVKELIKAGNEDYLIEHKGEFLKLYIKLFFKYPGDYIQAFVDQTGGYYFPEANHLVADNEGIVANDCGVYSSPLMRGKIIVKAKEIAIKLGNMVPLYGILWSCGSILWLIIISASYVTTNNNIRYFIVYMVPFCMVGILLLAVPVSGDYRYYYFLSLMIPVLSLLPFVNQGQSDN